MLVVENSSIIMLSIYVKHKPCYVWHCSLVLIHLTAYYSIILMEQPCIKVLSIIVLFHIKLTA